ncbi:RyR domain-containing protein [Catellatospora tritici]|uniref:RyR domain-containing protein n=1 Tax=Catellatospora tritici TaxID=2851566 RepID=UPI001C2DD080|nr:RyR domain-containing protein [Catellatospora tritici]MBV1856335.1 hypothetical protein [Catellatospora tritici]
MNNWREWASVEFMTDLEGHLDDLARVVHECYLADQIAAGVAMGAKPTMVAWDALTADVQEANRAQVADISAKLDSLGYTVAPADAAGGAGAAFSEAEVEQLSVREHQRWVAQRTAAGWTYSPVRDDAARHHPCLVPWADLAEVEKDKDRATVRRIPPLLAAVGLQMVRPRKGKGGRGRTLR